MSNAVKTLVSIAVAIAIPFAAPAIASAIGLSTGITAAVTAAGMSATVASTLGTAAVGAALGATKAAIFGEDIGRGALMGGIGGGAAGYATAPTAGVAGAGSEAASAAYSGGGGATFPGEVNPYVAPAATTVSPFGTDYMTSGYETAAGLNTATTPAVSTGAATTTAGAGLNTAGAPPVTNFDLAAANATADPIGSLAAGNPARFGAVDSAYATTAAAAPTTLTFAEALAKVPATIAAKFTDPATLADMVLRAGGSIAGSAIAGDGLSSEEKTLLNAQTQELRDLQKTNKELFDQKLQQAQNLIGESKYFDPEYFGLQRARRAQLAGAQAKIKGLRGLEGNRRASEERRIDLATSRDVGSSFDQGYLSGVEGRAKTMQAGLTAMPGYLTGYGGEYKNIYDQYGTARKRASEESKGIGDLFGSLTGVQKAKSAG